MLNLRVVFITPIVTGVIYIAFPTASYSSYRERQGYDQFADAYRDIVGHATAGTEQEVPWHFEIEQFLAFIGTESRYDLFEEFSIDREYAKLVGWEAEGDAGKIVFDGLDELLEKYIDSRAGGGFQQDDTGLWGDYWESWKWTHAEHIQSTVRSEFDITNLQTGEIESFLERFLA